MLNKMDELKERTSSSDIIGITETWGNKEISDCEFSMDGFILHRLDRRSGQIGGGVALYIRDTLVSALDEKYTAMAFDEKICCQLKYKDETTLIIVCYRSPSSSDDDDLNLLHLVRAAAEDPFYSEVLIMGDFNLPDIDYLSNQVNKPDTHFASHFFHLTNDVFLTQHVSENTWHRDGRTSSLIDYIFTREPLSIDTLQYTPPLGRSDHTCIEYSYNLGEDPALHKHLLVHDLITGKVTTPV
jgi:Endonuclease-reverse transcriptase